MTDPERDPSAASIFRSCGSCGRRWTTPHEFLHDAGLALVGLQVAEHRPESNLIVFEHACGSSVSVLTARLRPLAPDTAAGADLPDRYGTEECRRLCRQVDEWSACDRPCVNARDRRLLQAVIALKAGSGS